VHPRPHEAPGFFFRNALTRQFASIREIHCYA
jgi:hypothetical protein